MASPPPSAINSLAARCRLHWLALGLLLGLLLIGLNRERQFLSSWAGHLITATSLRDQEVSSISLEDVETLPEPISSHHSVDNLKTGSSDYQEESKPDLTGLTSANADIPPNQEHSAKAGNVEESARPLQQNGQDPYKTSWLKYQASVRSAGPLAVVTPRHPSTPLRIRGTPKCTASGSLQRIFMALDKGSAPKFSNQIWDKLVMAEFGFTTAKRQEDADVIVLSAARNLQASTLKLMDAGKQVVLLSKADDVSRGSDWYDAGHRNFLGILKEFTFRNLGNYLEPRWFGRPLSFHICNVTRFKPHPICSFKHHGDHTIYMADKFLPSWSKVRAVNWNWGQYWGILQNMPDAHKADPRITFDGPREIDVFMAVHVRDEPGSLARVQVLLELKKFKGNQKIFLCMHPVGKAAFPEHESVCLNSKAYAGHLKSTKVVICPWGFGERTSCEHGGWVMGAVVVKPWMDWVLSYPDMYRTGSTYLAVEPDYSDLAATVQHVAQNFGTYRNMRVEARSLFLNTVSGGNFVKHFWATICDLKANSR